MTPNDVRTILAFMSRVELRGSEAPEFVRVTAELQHLLVPTPPRLEKRVRKAAEKPNGEAAAHES